MIVHSLFAKLMRGVTPLACRAIVPGLRLLLCLLSVCLAPPALAVDANQASVQALMQVRGIGPKTALRIVRERERGGPFESLTDLAERVRGIGAKTVRRMQREGLRVVPPEWDAVGDTTLDAFLPER